MNRRDFLGAMAALGISVNTPIIFGSNTSSHNKRLVCCEEQPIKINITTTFETEQIFELGQIVSYEQIDNRPITIIELIYVNRTEKYKSRDKAWVFNYKPPFGMRRPTEHGGGGVKTIGKRIIYDTMYLSKTKDIFRIYVKHEGNWDMCKFIIDERIDEKT